MTSMCYLIILSLVFIPYLSTQNETEEKKKISTQPSMQERMKARLGELGISEGIFIHIM